MENETMVTDELMIEEAKADPTQFKGLYEKYFDQIFRFIYKRVNEEECTADLTQQVFLKAMNSLKKYKHKGFPFSSYLYRIAVNECNQFFRDKSKQRFVTLESIDTQLPLEISLDEFEEREAKLNALNNVLQNLEPQEILLIELRFFEKKSFKEIAYILDITENLSKVRTYRLLDKIKKSMEHGQQG